MTLKKIAVTFALGSAVLLTAGATRSTAQSHVNSPDPLLGTPSVATETSNVNGITGHADGGKMLYRRFCIGCHGPDGNGQGMNAQWIDPKPRDFTEATFKCRSTPTGTLPTDDDLYNAITRGFVDTNMPSWRPLNPQQRADLVAFIKTWSPRWAKEKPGAVLNIPPETPITIESILHGRELFQKLECWKCHGPEGHADGPSAATLTDSKGDPIKPFNFSTGDRFMCGDTNRDLYRIFMTGLDGSPMPSFADVIQPNDAWDLVHFLRTLQVGLPNQELTLWQSYKAAHGKDLKPIGPDSAGGAQ
ncbi:MAG TPA: cytochrome c [Candidatus Acidoferrales bacterium]|jgi:mono/diheme cytochrome c family protein|nr:cytochrome c [Candidatus Acidoferrales bacterium]